MFSALREKITFYVNEMIKLECKEKSKFLEKLNELLLIIDENIANFFGQEKIRLNRKIGLGPVSQAYSLSHCIKREVNRITIAEWLFDLPVTKKMYLLYILVVKEGMVNFLYPRSNKMLTSFEEVVINIISVLLCSKIFEITAFDSPLIASFRGRFYEPEIMGVDLHFWDNLFHLLFTRKIPFENIITKFKELTFDQIKPPSDSELIKKFSEWVYEQTMNIEDIAAPIYLSERLITIINHLIELGYAKGTANNIASLMNLHENTIRNQLLFLSENYTTFWNPEINWEKLNLHNYFLRIRCNDDKTYKKIFDYLMRIPYIRTLYSGRHLAKPIIYTPHMYCPHIIVDNLQAKLTEMLHTKSVDNYTVQITREKKVYTTLTQHPFDYNEKTFKELLSGKNSDYLHKYLLSHTKKIFSVEIKDEETVDYNLLFFLAILRNSYLFKTRLGVWVTELPNFYMLNKIGAIDVRKQTDFLNQIEIRARRREYLAYTLFIRSVAKKGSDILVIEIQKIDDYERGLLERIIDQIRIFSLMGQITLHDRIILTISGISNEHYIKNLVESILKKAAVEFTSYIIGLTVSRFIPLHDLYNFEEQKWKITTN